MALVWSGSCFWLSSHLETECPGLGGAQRSMRIGGQGEPCICPGNRQLALQRPLEPRINHVPFLGLSILHCQIACLPAAQARGRILYERAARGRGAWVAQSVERLTSAQGMTSGFVGSSPVSGSVLTAQGLEPALDSVSPSLSPPLAFSLCLCLCLSLSLK